jgi:cell shape-determining protein MreC
MALSLTFFIVAFLVIAVWLVIEFKRLKHKLLAFFLIGLILFTYISFTASLKGHDTDFTSVSGIIEAGKLYLSWVAGVFGNFKSITAYAFKQDWKTTDTNITILEEKEKSKESIWEKLK